MRLNIRTARYDLDRDLENYIERRLHFATARFAPRLDSIQVVVGDDNGPRGGVDKFCTIRCSGHGLEAFLVRGEDADIRAAVDFACARLQRAIVRQLERGRFSRSVQPGIARTGTLDGDE